ncbi:MAG: hypothetical protein LM580_07215 [Thermofilum sp.]|nr:hypothetical protein [Thermofilum sp.]
MLGSRDLYRLTKIVTVYVENSLNQPVTVQILGAVSSSPSSTVPIGSSFTVSAGAADAKTLVPESSGWLPYITVSLACSTAPTSGAVRVLLIRFDGTTVVIVNNLAIRDTSAHTYATDPSYVSVVPW